jgi:hypothetical protein
MPSVRGFYPWKMKMYETLPYNYALPTRCVLFPAMKKGQQLLKNTKINPLFVC